MSARVLLLVALLLPSTAFAEDPPPPPSRTATVVEKSPTVALALSLGLTAGGLGMMVAAGETESATLAVSGFFVFLAGPTTGHWYAGSFGNGGTLLRLAGLGVFVIGVSQLDLFSSDDNDDATGPLIAGTVMYSVGGIYEIITAPGAVHEYNDEKRRFALTPLVTPNASGLALAGTF